MFKITAGKGFSIVLLNDWEVSVQWGPSNYCDNRWNKAIPYDKSEPEYGEWQSKTAELRALDVLGKPLEFSGGEEVLGYCTVEQVLEFISAVSKLPDRKPLEAWEGKWLGTIASDLEDFDHVAASIGIDSEVLRNDSG